MSGIRAALLPLDHLEAELLAFPLASEAALGLSLVELHPLLGGATGNLWRAAERELLGSWPAMGLDEVVALRDRLWWYRADDHDTSSSEPLPLGKYLRCLARRALDWRGSVAVPHLLPDKAEPAVADLEPRARGAWRWLSIALPPDLLLASLGEHGSAPHTVNQLEPTLERGLADQGYAEPHLHLSAALDFPLLWVATLRGLAEHDNGPDAFKSPGAGLSEGRNLGRWLLRAALVRYLLAAFLQPARRLSRRDELATFLQDKTNLLLATLGACGTTALASAFRELERGKLLDSGERPRDHAPLRALYRRLIRPLRRFPDSPNEVWAADPVASLVPWSSQRGVSPEISFVNLALEYLDSNPKDSFFVHLFWQTVRVRCLFYRHVVQRPLTPGLQWFMRTFDRMKAGRRLVGDRLKIASALRLGNAGAGLLSLELRASPEATLNGMAAVVQAISQAETEEPNNHSLPYSPLLRLALANRRSRDRATGYKQKPELGLVVHFQRERGGDWSKGRPASFWQESHADPSSTRRRAPKGGNASGFRYARFYLKSRKAARALATYLVGFPASLRLIRGLDVCSDEVAVPTWVLAPLIRHVRAAGHAAARSLRGFFGYDVPPLRMTAHVGEDFIHPLTGLRSIDEAIGRFELRAGDRLGHALALGVDPADWAQQGGRLAMPREDRLLDLVWEWRWYARCEPGPVDRTASLHREIALHSERMFGTSVAPETLERMIDLLHEETTLRLFGYPVGFSHFGDRAAAIDSRDPNDLAYRYLTSVGVFDRGREIVRIDPAREVTALKVLADGLRRKVSSRGLVIEINPSSNLLVGDLAELRRHPIWQLNQPNNSGAGVPLRICIGSDDPLTFATRLPEEYQLIHDAMMLSGRSQGDAQAWIEKARQTGLDARFTLPRPESPPPIEPWLVGAGPPIPLPP